MSTVQGLSSERTRWEATVKRHSGALLNLPGDALLGAAFLTYCGPFDVDARAWLVSFSRSVAHLT